MITFDQIQKANEGLSTINMRDKPYVMVPQRVKAFRMLYPEGFITTEILSNENGVCLMKTDVGYYDGERRVVLGTGMAYEKETNGYVNRTSYIENCETSSVGRALGFLALGIDGGGICSAEELVNAVNNQGRNPANTVSDAQAIIPSVKNQTMDLSEIRSRLEVAIRERTKDLSREEKIKFLNEVVMPALNGERNWKICDNPGLLLTLLTIIENRTV